MRMREYSDVLPKPMVPIGYRPILWHVMKYYAHFGHTDFILCLGYRADIIKKYFLEYDECLSNDFVLSKGGKHLELLSSDIGEWKITFVDTGLTSNIGQRLKAVEKHIDPDEYFLANYTDGLADIDINAAVAALKTSGKIASFVGVKPRASFHLVESEPDGVVRRVAHISQAGNRINGGYFVFRRDIFKYMRDGEELVDKPFQRLIAEGQLLTYRHDGFWACMDTFKEKQELEDIQEHGRAPWAVWNHEAAAGGSR